MKRLLTALLVVVAALAAYLLLWPVPIEPVAWQAPKPGRPSDQPVPNDLLAAARPAIEK